ncbi:MAG: cyclic nucleotide-binding domain-containing protein [Deltaproteobacteria bacterium]|nr:cyclic nucleotide-binding domain-containing protein [Deltaproteobacteria bacterium]
MFTRMDELASLTRGRMVSTYQPGQTIFYMGHFPTGLWVLLDGEVALFSNHHGHSYVTGPCLLGAEEMATATTYGCSARAITECALVFIGREEAREVLKQPSQTSS